MKRRQSESFEQGKIEIDFVVGIYPEDAKKILERMGFRLGSFAFSPESGMYGCCITVPVGKEDETVDIFRAMKQEVKKATRIKPFSP